MYQEGTFDSACILNISVELRSTLVALFHVVNMFLTSNLLNQA